MTTNPLVTVTLAAIMASVVLLRRSNEPWARSVGAYFALAGVVLAVRLVLAIIIGAGRGTTVLFTLPQLELPAWMAGIRLGGAVTAEPLAYTSYDSLRLGLMLLCLGAANALANPKRALKSVPPALYEASVAIVIALTVAPQLVESTQRIRRAQQLRGGSGRGLSAVTAVLLPVLGDAIDRSLHLAAGMEARGFGRTRLGRHPNLLATGGVLLAALVATFGAFGVLGAADRPAQLAAAACLVAGTAGTAFGLRASGRRLAVTRYRPDPWTPSDTALVASGLVGFVAAVVLGGGLFPDAFAAMHPSTDPLVWPALHPGMALIAVAGLAPLVLTTVPDEQGCP